MEPIKQWLLIGLLLITSNVTLHAAYAQQIDTYMQTHATFSGAVLVAQDNTILFKKGYGYANYEFAISNDENTRFPIASNTKSFTAVAIMMLHEKNVLNVHEPLCRYISGFPDTITIHHLLTHTSGIPNYYQHWTSISNCTQLEEMVNMIKTWDLEFKPGSQFSYSNTGYLLLAYLIEKLSGLPFESFLAEHIFKPLQMHDSGSIRNNHAITKKASGYHMQENKLCNAPSIHNPLTLVGNGDLYASIMDMHRWIQGLFSGNIINSENLNILLDSHIIMENIATRWHGYGWFIDTSSGKRVVEYSGALVGYVSKVMRILDENITIIVLTNREDYDQLSAICTTLPTLLQAQY